MKGKLKGHRIAIFNLGCCAVIGGTFGLLSGNLLPWLVVSAGIGGGLGLTAEALSKAATGDKRRRMRGLLALLVAEALLVLCAVVPGYSAYLTVHPGRRHPSVTPADIGLEYEDVTLVTEDGLRLAAWWVPGTNGAAVVVTHGLGGCRAETLLHVAALANGGYSVLTFDLRAHGESEGDRFALGWESERDVQAAVEYVQSRGDVAAGRIGALGLSVGASAVLYAAAESESIGAVVVDGTPLGTTADALEPMLPEIKPVFFMTPIRWVEQEMTELFSGHRGARPIKEYVPRLAPRPILFIAAGGDSLEPALARRYQALAGPHAEVWVVPGVGHLGGMSTYPEEYGARMRSFFDAHLLAGTGK